MNVVQVVDALECRDRHPRERKCGEKREACDRQIERDASDHLLKCVGHLDAHLRAARGPQHPDCYDQEDREHEQRDRGALAEITGNDPDLECPAR